jgi:hypothetical protein
MKIKYLKKLRKRYTWFWEDDFFRVLDHKTKRVLKYGSIRDFIHSTLPLSLELDNLRKIRERRTLAEYRNYVNNHKDKFNFSLNK